jgi:hypothetical protein
MTTNPEPPIRYISKLSAQQLWQELLTKAGIPLRSTTAKCMFEKTNSSRGNQCQFGLTPLWENVLRKNRQGEVLHSEFMDLAQRLLDSAQTRQDAGRR